VLGCFLLAAGYVVMAYAATFGGKISWLWLALYIAIITTGEIFLSPIAQSLYSKVSPLRIVSIMMAVQFIPNFLGGGFLQGYIGIWWEKMSHPQFFLIIAGLGVVSGLIVWAMEKPLRVYLQKSHD
jgi:POT family proton-dependent oligopeptide transporter